MSVDIELTDLDGNPIDGIVTIKVTQPKPEPEPEPQPTPEPTPEPPKLYLTQPPQERKLSPHPRILLTADQLPALREKLASPEYVKRMAELKASTGPVEQALVYLLYGDMAAQQAAKLALLSGSIEEWKGMDKAALTIQAALLFDWLYDTLSPSELVIAARVVEDTIAEDRKEPWAKDPTIPYYWNDMWARGPSQATIAALALAGDSAWADSVYSTLYTDQHKYFSPYLGGAVDVLNTLSLSSGGGIQAGVHEQPGSGYESMFLTGVLLFLAAWDTATGEDISSKTTFLQKYPHYVAQVHYGIHAPAKTAQYALEMITGHPDQESAALAKWLLDEHEQGHAFGSLVPRLILGDLRTEAHSPEELGLPLTTYIEGADLVVSRDSWSKDALIVSMFARHWDTSRFEPESGGIAIYKNGKPLLVRSTASKIGFDYQTNSSLWIWQEGNIIETVGQGSRYWQKLNNGPRAPRPYTAAPVLAPDAEGAPYRPETLKSFTVTPLGFTATTRFEQLLKYQGVEKAERNLTQQGNIITVTDSVIVPDGGVAAQSFRLAQEPQINGNVATIDGLKITVSPDVELHWIGGYGREFEGPEGHWHGNNHGGYVPGYSTKDPHKVELAGLGTLFAIPKTRSTHYDFTSQIEVTP